MFFPILRIVPFFQVLCTCFLMSCIGAEGPGEGAPGFRVYFVDVGQGDACVLRTPGNRWFLYDIGNEERSLIAFLRHVRADTLQAAFISHPDLDHFGAFPALLHAFPVKKVYLPEGTSPYPAWLGMIRDLDALATQTETLYAGDTVEFGERVHGRVLWPVPHSSMTGNDMSTVLRIDYAGKRILLTGDIEDPAEKAILEEGFDLASDILKVAHHGSRTSSSLEFVAAVRPRWAVISCDSVVYGHPHAEAVDDLAVVMGGTEGILRTDREGTVGFEIREGGVWRINPWE